jgi:hypothetical protein
MAFDNNGKQSGLVHDTEMTEMEQGKKKLIRRVTIDSLSGDGDYNMRLTHIEYDPNKPFTPNSYINWYSVEVMILLLCDVFVIAVLTVNGLLEEESFNKISYTTLDYIMITTMLMYANATFIVHRHLESDCNFQRVIMKANLKMTSCYLVVAAVGTVSMNYACGRFLIPALMRLPIIVLNLVNHIQQHSNHRRIMSLIEKMMHIQDGEKEAPVLVPSSMESREVTRGMTKADRILLLDTDNLKGVQFHLRRVFVINLICLLVFYISMYVDSKDIEKDIPVVVFMSLMFISSMITSNYTIGRYNQIIDIAEYSSLRKLRLKVKFGYWAPTSELFLSVTLAFVYLIFTSVKQAVDSGYVACRQ